MANIFLDANDSFTQSSTNTNDSIFGRSGGTENVILQGNPIGTRLDGNVEVVQVAGTAASTTLQVNATTGQLELVSGGTVFATFTGGLNQAVSLRFTDGDVTLTQTGANAFTIANPANAANNVTINPTTPQAGGVVTLGSQTSTAGTTTGGGTTTPVGAQTFTLTTGNDNITGTAGADSIQAVLQGAGATGTTIQPGDSIKGAGGNDTLQIAVAGDAGGPYTLAAVTVTDVENVLLNNFDQNAVATTVDTSLMSGLTTVGLTASSATGDTVFSNLNSLVSAQMANGSADLTLDYNASAVSGTADTQSLKVANVTEGSFLADSIETLNIESATAKNTLSLATTDDYKTVNVTGNQQLTLNVNDANNTITKIDASAATGSLVLSGLGTTEIAITGGTANDTVTAANITSADTINGGDGVDTLVVTSALTSANAAKITNFETLEARGDFTQDVSAVAGITTLVAAASGGADDTVAFTNATATQALTVKSVDSADDDVSVALAADTSADVANVTLGTATAGVTLDDLTLNEAETINIANNGGTSFFDGLLSADATSVVLTGSKQLTLDGFATANLTTLDASAMTGKFIMSAPASNKDATIKGGVSDDILVGGTGKDTIIAGAGTNTITAGAGNDTVTGGDGKDTINEVVGNDSINAGGGDDTIVISDLSDLTKDDVINGGDGTDTISFSEDANHDFTADTTIVSGISNVEKLQFSVLTGSNDTVTINDAIVSGGAITLEASGTTAGAIFNASGILSSTTTVTFSDTTTVANTYIVGNGKDVVSMGAGNDTINVNTAAFLFSGDSLDGGAGADTLNITQQVSAATTLTAGQLGAIKNIETLSFNTNAANAGTGDYVLTLTDTFVGANVAAGATLSINRGDQATTPDTGKLTVDGSAVTSTYVLALSGASGADTFKGGAGNDVLDGGLGNDTLTGGLGSDDFKSGVVGDTSTDTITDFNFGAVTGTTTVDQLDLSDTFTMTSVADVDRASGEGVDADSDVIILDQAAYQDALAAEDAVVAGNGTGEVIVIWQNTLGEVFVSRDAVAETDATGFENTMFKLDGVSIQGIAALINSGDFLI